MKTTLFYVVHEEDAMGPMAAQKCIKIIQDKIKNTLWNTHSDEFDISWYFLKSLGNLGEQMKALLLQICLKQTVSP